MYKHVYLHAYTNIGGERVELETYNQKINPIENFVTRKESFNYIENPVKRTHLRDKPVKFDPVELKKYIDNNGTIEIYEKSKSSEIKNNIQYINLRSFICSNKDDDKRLQVIDTNLSIISSPVIDPTKLNQILEKANLSRQNLSGADLSSTNLSNANLSNANLSGTNLKDADLKDADLSGAKFYKKPSEAKNITPEQIQKAKNCEKAIYSPEFRKELDNKQLCLPPKK